jgi:hypothetical protein
VTAPGIPPSASGLAAGTETPRAIDRATGWVSHSDTSGDGAIQQYEVATVPRSLLQKSLVAQAVFDNKFLLPFAPEPPRFFLVPGENQVTVVWQPSATEALGDPFYAIANDPGSALFDPNFRQIDVEGYRVYRGRTAGALELVAQFDYAGTTFVDRTGAISYGNCAPELGINGSGTDCPVTFDFPISITGPSNAVDISGNLVQIPAGGRVLLADDATVVPLVADTAITGGGSNLPGLTNTGVPFAYTDRGVRNSLTYFYAVTAFDVNSRQSGPSSLESAPIAQSVTPRAPATNAQAAELVRSLSGDDGVALNTEAEWPAIDPETGTFNGNVPPTNSGTFDFLAAVAEALPAGDIELRIDSVDAGMQGGFGDSPTLYVTMSAGGNTVTASQATNQPNFNAAGTNEYDLSAPLVPYDSALSQRMGLAFTDSTVRMPVEFTGASVPFAHASPSVATGSGRYLVEGYETSRYLAHSRWFDDGAAEPADPTITSVADSSHNSGALTGVGRIWAPSTYRSALADISANFRGYAGASTAWYPADFVVEWGAGGTITVRDVTHNTTLPQSNRGSGWGFLTLANVLATGVDLATFVDLIAADDAVGTPIHNIINYKHLYMTDPTCVDWQAGITAYCVPLSGTAELQPLDFNTDGVADGNGIVLIVNGEAFFMGMNALPAAGTRWHLRAISGVMTADCTPGLGPVMTDCANYTFVPNPVRPTNVPGLRYRMTVEQQFSVNPDADADLEKVHTVPDPYYVTNAMEITTNRKVLKFVNLPARAIIRIYSLSGVLISVLEHNDPMGGGETDWNLRNRNNQFVASGVYFYHIETPTGRERIGRFTVVNFAQ